MDMTGRTHSILSALKPWVIVIAAFVAVGLVESFADLIVSVFG